MTERLFMETTQIDPQKTVGQIMALLVKAGARQLLQEYDDAGELIGVKFSLEINKQTVLFSLPSRSETIYKIINGRRQYEGNEEKDRIQSKRVAWRQLLRWTEAQLALIQTGMVEAGEVFLPYREIEPGVTLWDKIQAAGGRLALPPAPTEESNVKRFPEARL